MATKNTKGFSKKGKNVPYKRSAQQVDSSKLSFKKEEVDDLAKELRKKAHDFINNDDIVSLLSLIPSYQSKSINVKELIKQEKWNLESKIFSDWRTDMNLLHMALDLNKVKCAGHMINEFPLNYLLQTYTNIESQVPPSCKSCLHIICEKGRKELFDLLMIRLNKISSTGWRLARICTEESNNEKEEYLKSTVVVKIEDNLEVDNKKRRASAVHLATMNGHYHLLKPLKDNGLDMDAEDNFGETPLMWSIWANKPESFKILIMFGANVNHVNKHKSSPLHLAVTHDRREMFYELVDLKADLKLEQTKTPCTILEGLASRNKHEVIKKLLDQKFIKRIDPESILKSLFVAAKNGFEKSVIEILEVDANLVNATDNLRNTPILTAADNEQFEIVKLLHKNYGADITVKNSQSETIYDMAMRQPTSDMFKYLIQKLTRDGLIYLHVAAAANDLEKMEFIIDNRKAKVTDIDARRNTIFHTAAAYNSHDVLKHYLKKDDDLTDLQNTDRHTALLLAVRKGHMESFDILMENNARIDLEDINDQNILHAAVSSANSNSEIVKKIVEKTKKHFRFLLNKQDSNGNTALHLAAKFFKANLIDLLSDLDPEVKNQDGEIPLHSAVRYGTIKEVQAIITIFYLGKKNSIDYQDESGHSALFISAVNGDVEIFEHILSYGADIMLRNKKECTILHKIVKIGVSNLSRSDKYIGIFKKIVEWSAEWYCRKKGLIKPAKFSTQHYEYQLRAVRYLTSDLYYNGCNVLQYAAKLGNADLLKTILKTPNVYKFTVDSPLSMVKKQKSTQEKYSMSNFFKKRAPNEILYDVSYMIPAALNVKEIDFEKIDKMDDENAVPKRRARCINFDVEWNEPQKIGLNSNSSNNAEADDKTKGDQIEVSNRQTKHMISCLEYLVDLRDQEYTNKVLDDEPFKFLISKYWTYSRRGYEIFMWIHLFHMIVFTCFTMPNKEYLDYRFSHTNSGGGKSKFTYSPMFFALFLIWPLLIIIYEIILGIIFILSIRRHWRKGMFKKFKWTEETQGLMTLPLGIMHFVLNNLNHFSTAIFCVLTAVWFSMVCFIENKIIYLECLAAVLIFGWLHTINYVKGFKDWNALANIFKLIIFKDIIRFAYIYVFILVSFGFAIHVLLQTEFSEEYNDLANTLYLIFYKMLNPDDILSDGNKAKFEESGGQFYILAIVYSVYSILSTIVLMNLLIAMMNNTYSDIVSIEATVWRISSLKLALWYERNNFRLVGGQDSEYELFYDKSENRYMIVVSYDSEIVNEREDTKGINKDENVFSPSSVQRNSERGKIDNIIEQIELLKREMDYNSNLTKNMIMDIKDELIRMQQLYLDTCEVVPRIWQYPN